jgi:ABC-type cobalt transport system substrate-binding protein
MKPKIAAALVLLVAMTFGFPAVVDSFVGADESVIEKFATDAGRKTTTPLVNADSGEMGRLLWLMAGVAGGFTLGYCFRSLSVKKKNGRPSDV